MQLDAEFFFAACDGLGAHTDGRTCMCVDVCVDMCVVMCIDMCAGICVDMCADM